MAKKTIYRAAAGATFSQKDAPVIGRELEKLGTSITPIAVVTAAKSKSSPLHPLFEWDDLVAADRFRLVQARNIVNHLEVVVVNSAGQKENIKAYFSQSVDTEDENGETLAERRYLHIDIVKSSPIAAQNAVEMAKTELLGWKQRYSQYQSHFGHVFAAIESVASPGKKNRR